MEIEDKILKVLSRYLAIEYFRLEDEDDIYGFVVSPSFQGMSSLDRQKLIDKALDEGSDTLAPEERRRVRFLATMTPVEFKYVGSRVQIHRVREMANGMVEVRLRGGLPDAKYIRGILSNQKGVRTSEPKQVSELCGVFTSFRAKGTKSTPLTKAKALRILKSDPYIEVMPNS